MPEKPEFRPWPSIARMNRDAIVTEKIDGTNAAIEISYDIHPGRDVEEGERYEGGVFVVNPIDKQFVWVGAQSRKRLISPESDNFGFARWVMDNAESLAGDLGSGKHFGEWWGSGIQRGYGIEKGVKYFSLFNAKKWTEPYEAGRFKTENLRVVPILDIFTFDTDRINGIVRALAESGSVASPGFKPPEGVVVFHTAAQTLYKVTCDHDEVPKSLAPRN
jgi:hypothetical protein